MMVRPMTRSLTPRARANATAASTSHSEPSTSRPSPSTMSSTCTAQWLSRHRGASRHPRTLRGLPRTPRATGAPGTPCKRRAGRAADGFPAAQLAVEHHHDQHHRRADHDRHFLADDLRMHHQRRNQGADAEDEQHVEDVAAHHVADGDVGTASSAAPTDTATSGNSCPRRRWSARRRAARCRATARSSMRRAPAPPRQPRGRRGRAGRTGGG